MCESVITTVFFVIYYSENKSFTIESVNFFIKYESIKLSDLKENELQFVVRYEPESFNFDFLKIDYDFSQITDNIKNFFVNAYKNLKKLFK
jgi:hypothetical protein